ncbi:potassium transporter [Prolixibacteraceae bacterium JC049]|nr:potassium transporter [Prolixibacteraceae bacterium JC049]
MEHFLLQLFIYLTAAVIAVPIAKRLGLDAVLGYLIAGMVIGPSGLALIGEIEAVMHFTEFGIVMMLFLVGLELKPSLLLKMRVRILGMGGIQVALSSLIIGGIAFLFLPWQMAMAVGIILALSSTAIVLQTLQERGIMNTSGGRSIFSVLLFQDLAVIPILAILPFLATFSIESNKSYDSALYNISGLPGTIQFVIILITILSIFFAGKYAIRPIFRAIAATRVREIFIAAALALVVGISLLMTVVGLSPALGAFLAGVVLADSEYRHELESDIEPYKGLLLGIFFISIGASFNFLFIQKNLFLIIGLTISLLFVKALVLWLTSVFFKIPKKDRSLFTIALAQGGEFAFILFQFAKNNGVLHAKTVDPLISAVAISMFLTPLMFLLYDKWNRKANQAEEKETDTDDIENNDQKVILAGFGRLGRDLGRFLITSGVKPVILDNDITNVNVLRKFGYEVYYGDITRLDLLKAAGASEAKLLIIAIGDTEQSIKLVELVRKYYPEMKILVAAANRTSAYELMDLGVTNVRRLAFGSALKLGKDALEVLGVEPYQAHRMMLRFNKYDEQMLKDTHQLHQKDEASYINMYKKHMVELEEIMTIDMKQDLEQIDKAWSTSKNEK